MSTGAVDAGSVHPSSSAEAAERGSRMASDTTGETEEQPTPSQQDVPDIELGFEDMEMEFEEVGVLQN